jgi:hypothetical protein
MEIDIHNPQHQHMHAAVSMQYTAFMTTPRMTVAMQYTTVVPDSGVITTIIEEEEEIVTLSSCSSPKGLPTLPRLDPKTCRGDAEHTGVFGDFKLCCQCQWQDMNPCLPEISWATL